MRARRDNQQARARAELDARARELPRFDVNTAPPVIPEAALQPFWVSPLAKAALGIGTCSNCLGLEPRLTGPTAGCSTRHKRALRENDAKRALQLLSEHATRFPSGKMGSAREVTRMLALCQSGRGVEARAEAERFLARHPVSARKPCPNLHL